MCGSRIGTEYAKTLTAGGHDPSAILRAGARGYRRQVTAIRGSIVDWMGIPSAGFLEASSSVLGGEARSVPIYPLRMTFGPLGSPDAPKWRAIRAVGVHVVSPGSVHPDRAGPAGDMPVHLRWSEASLHDVLLNVDGA